MVDVNEAMAQVLDNLTLADMVSRSADERSRRANVVDYNI
jgi:DNA-binding IscR family transcriptional regulator